MEIKKLKASEISPYSNNNRKHSEVQIKRIAESISEFGFNQPIVVDESNTILVGHGRYAAALELGLDEVPVVVLESLSEAQKKAYRILDNKLQNESSWDLGNLEEELRELDALGFEGGRYGMAELAKLVEEAQETADKGKYSRKVEAPIYSVKGKCPSVEELYDRKKAFELLEQIREAEGLPQDVIYFLEYAAMRHVRINFEKVAEFYAHAEPKVQELMEASALVIIDFDKAIENGFAVLVKDLLAAMDEEDSCPLK